jgi:hypothetical protein
MACTMMNSKSVSPVTPPAEHAAPETRAQPVTALEPLHYSINRLVLQIAPGALTQTVMATAKLANPLALLAMAPEMDNARPVTKANL